VDAGKFNAAAILNHETEKIREKFKIGAVND
jgi:hypothetical protein